MYVTDGTQGASVLAGRNTALKPGDIVDAVGFPVLDNYKRTIQDAIFRRDGEGPPPEPRSIDAKQALSGDFDGDLVRIEGRLVEQHRNETSTRSCSTRGTPSFRPILPEPAESARRRGCPTAAGSN